MLGKLSATMNYGILASFASVALFLYLYGNQAVQPYSAWILAWSTVTFLLYGFDKSRANAKKSRIPNVVLHALALVGGFMGAWFAMFGFWHKIRQLSFWAILILSTLLHGAILDYFYQ